MARDNNIIQRRNQAIRKEYYRLEQKFPKWKYSAYLDQLGEMFWLAPTTIAKILNA